MQDFALDVEELSHRLDALRFRGCQGTTGTQASFLELFGGDHEKVRELERRVTAKLGFAAQFAVTGQTYPRKTDSMVLDVLSGIAQSAAKMAGDLRLLQHEGELLEPFESDQIGSSAMAYKRNPMRAERIAGLARYVISLQANGPHTAASQWLERTLDDSANRRLTLPEAFLGTDAILVLAANIAAGLEVREDVIRRHVDEQMPYMVTERCLMLGVAAGGDRQALHEVIRRHSLAVAEAVSRGGRNDLLDRLVADPAFSGVPVESLRAELDPARYTGRARPTGRGVHRRISAPVARASTPARGGGRCLRGSGMTLLAESQLPLPLLRRGKVREVYEVDARHLLLVASDRVSAFDVVLREPIPHKGAVLTQISAFWFERLADVFPSHFITADVAQIVDRVPSLRAACGPDGRSSHARAANRARVVRMRRARLPHRVGMGRVQEDRHARRRGAPARAPRERSPRSPALFSRHEGGHGSR